MFNYRELKRRYELDGATAHRRRTSPRPCAKSTSAPEDFSLRDLAEALIPDGHHWVRARSTRAAPAAWRCWKPATASM